MAPTKKQFQEQDEATARYDAARAAVRRARATHRSARGKAKRRAARVLNRAIKECEAAEREYTAKRLGGMAYPEQPPGFVRREKLPTAEDDEAALAYFLDTGDRSQLDAIKAARGL